MKKPCVLITGGTGFIGSHLVDALVKDEYKVIVLKRSTSSLWRLQSSRERIQFIDIDKVTIPQIFQSNKVEIVVHLATHYKKNDCLSSEKELIEANVVFPEILVREAIKYGVKGFINTGTFFEYDCGQQPISEASNIKPFNFYAKTKILFEEKLKKYESNLCINTLKIFTPFGERDNPKLITTIIQNGLKNKPIELSNGFQKLDLIYIKDVVDSYIKSIERMISVNYYPEYENFNIGSGEPLSIRDVVSLTEEVLGYRLNVSWGSKKNNEIKIAYADIKKAHKFLGWKPCYTVKKGLSNYRYYLEKGDILEY